MSYIIASWRGVLDTTLCDQVCQPLAAGRWFSPVSSTNKTDRHDITEILLKVAISTIHHWHSIISSEEYFKIIPLLQFI